MQKLKMTLSLVVLVLVQFSLDHTQVQAQARPKKDTQGKLINEALNASYHHPEVVEWIKKRSREGYKVDRLQFMSRIGEEGVGLVFSSREHIIIRGKKKARSQIIYLYSGSPGKAKVLWLKTPLADLEQYKGRAASYLYHRLTDGVYYQARNGGGAALAAGRLPASDDEIYMECKSPKGLQCLLYDLNTDFSRPFRKEAHFEFEHFVSIDEAKSRPELCDEFNSKNRVKCRTYVARATRTLSVCNDIDSTKGYQHCVARYARKEKDKSICEKIKLRKKHSRDTLRRFKSCQDRIQAFWDRNKLFK